MNADGRPAASSETIRRSMKANRGKNTRPELQLRKLLRDAGYPGYRLHWKRAPGCPDIAYPGRKVAIFVNGCFWHRCPHCNPSFPASHSDFWRAKFEANIARDHGNLGALAADDWTAITIWECELKAQPEQAVRRIAEALDASTRPCP